MNYILSFILFLIILLLGCIYWLNGTKTISGQVFIVTKGRGNVEMGSLEIRFIEEKELLEFREKNISGIFNSLIAEFERKLKSEETDQGKSYKEFNYIDTNYSVTDLEGKANEILIEIEKLKMPSKTKAMFSEACYSEYNKKLSPILILMNKDLIQLVLNNSYSLEVFGIGNMVARTDSNGRFNAKIPLSKKGWLVAHCERQVFDKVEKYYWIEPITSDTIMLTNDNLWE